MKFNRNIWSIETIENGIVKITFLENKEEVYKYQITENFYVFKDLIFEDVLNFGIENIEKSFLAELINSIKDEKAKKILVDLLNSKILSCKYQIKNIESVLKEIKGE